MNVILFVHLDDNGPWENGEWEAVLEAMRAIPGIVEANFFKKFDKNYDDTGRLLDTPDYSLYARLPPEWDEADETDDKAIKAIWKAIEAIPGVDYLYGTGRW